MSAEQDNVVRPRFGASPRPVPDDGADARRLGDAQAMAKIALATAKGDVADAVRRLENAIEALRSRPSGDDIETPGAA